MKMEAKAANKECVFKLVTIVATGGQFQWGTMEDNKEYTSELFQLRMRKLGHFQ